MQGYGRTLITTVGSEMLTDVDGAKGKITYTKAVLYAQDIKGMSEDEQRALTEIDDEQMSTPIIVTDINDNTVTVSASFNNAKLAKDIKFNSIGWFAKTSVDDQERLLAVTPSDAEQTIVAGSSGASTSALDINMAFARNDNATVVIKPTEAGLINQAQLDAATNQVKINLEAEITTQVNNITDQMKNLGKVQKVNNQWPGSDGNVDINTADNITILPDNSSFNDVFNPGFYRGNSLKDGPYINVNDVFAVYGQKYAGSAITQVVYRAIHFDNTSRNYTRIYTRMGYFDSNLNVHWGNWNANIANIHINNTDPDNNGNVNINTLDNPTMLAYGTSLNNVIKPGFYRANACKDGPIADSIYNDVFCIIGVYKPGTVLTQFLPIAYYSTPDYLNNHTELYLRTAYLDNNLIAHWGAYHKISTPLA